MAEKAKFPKLDRGTVVEATKDLDRIEGKIGVPKGTRGMVFEEADTRDPVTHFGPFVVWTNGHVCNVYDGQIVIVPFLNETLDFKSGFIKGIRHAVQAVKVMADQLNTLEDDDLEKFLATQDE